MQNTYIFIGVGVLVFIVLVAVIWYMSNKETLFVRGTTERQTAESTEFPKAEKPLTFIETEPPRNEFERNILDQSDPYRYSMVFDELSFNLHPMGFFGEGRAFGPAPAPALGTSKDKFGPEKMAHMPSHMMSSKSKLFMDAYAPVKGECIPGWVPDRVRTEWVGGLDFPTNQDTTVFNDPVAAVLAE